MLRVTKNGEKLIEILDDGRVNLLKEGLKLEDVLGDKEENEKEPTKKDEEEEKE